MVGVVLIVEFPLLSCVWETELCLRFEEISKATGGQVHLSMNLVGGCDKNPDSLHFVDTNFAPRSLASLISWQQFTASFFNQTNLQE